MRVVLVLSLVAGLAMPAMAKPAPPPPDGARPWIGVGIEQGKGGVLLNEVIDGAPGAAAGLRVGDEVLAIGKNPVRSPQQLVQTIGVLAIGEHVDLHVVRGKRQLTLSVVLGPKLDDQEVLERRLLDKAAPRFALDRIAGASPAKLADLRGKVVLIEFLATWCGPCKSTYRPLGDLQRRHVIEGLAVIGIVNGEAKGAVQAMADREQVGFTLLHDQAGLTGKAYRPSATPTFVVIDRRGVVRFVGSGADVAFDQAVFTAERLLAADN